MFHKNIPWFVEQVNETKRTTPKKTPQGWETIVKNISRLAERNPTLFFRRVKQDLFARLFHPSLRMPSHGVAKLIRVRNPCGPTEVEELVKRKENEDKQHEELSDESIRKLARAARRKAVGPRRVQPCALYILPHSDSIQHVTAEDTP